MGTDGLQADYSPNTPNDHNPVISTHNRVISKEPAQPDQEVLMEAWNGLTDTMKQYFVLLVKSRREKMYNQPRGNLTLYLVVTVSPIRT